MLLPPLLDGVIHRRYKRFLADVELADGRLVTAHCANTGSMEGCWAPGAPVQLSESDNPRRKLRFTLERVDMGAGWVGVNTLRVNAIVAEGIAAGRIGALSGYREIRREPRAGVDGDARSRFDLALLGDGPRCLVEIKNATLLRDGVIQFPDAVTSRGRKHLALLEVVRRRGERACLVFAINRPESDRFAPATAIDPDYADSLYRVREAGVEVHLAWLRHLPQAIEVARSRPFDDPRQACAAATRAAG